MKNEKSTAMKVEDIMTQRMNTCGPTATLAEAAKLMWDGDFGVLPVMDAGKLVGMITDRDICIGVASLARMATQIPATMVMSKEVFTCAPADSISKALDIMAKHRVRRLPVVTPSGELKGVLSLNDIIQEAKSTRSASNAPGDKDILAALQNIGRHRDLPAATLS